MKRLRLTLRARLTLVYGALFLVAGLVMLSVTWVLVQQQFLSDGSGQVIRQVGEVGSTGPPPGIEDPSNLVDDGAVTNYYVEVVDAARDDALRALLTQGAIAVVLVGALAVWIGWLVAGRMLHPLATITATARRIADAPDADRRMHERIRLDGPQDEVTELADTFDGMLARLDTSFDAQRRFIANASHELRTPLTLNRALLEVSTNRADASADVKLLGGTLLEINARHERLIDGLLLLARSERALAERRFVDLADIVEHVARAPDGAAAAAAAAAAPDDADEADETTETTDTADTAASVELVTGEAPTSGDPVLLEQLVRNLVENGLRHNVAEGGWVRVETRTDPDGHAVLEVSNTGPVVPPYELVSLFEPFRRLDGERTAEARGVGLGLSIVRAIVQAHDGTVSLAARPEGGLVVTVALPGERYESGPPAA